MTIEPLEPTERTDNAPSAVTIQLDADGAITNPIDVMSLCVALHTVPGHRFEDDRIAVAMIVSEAKKQLTTYPDIEIKIGQYLFLFTTKEEPEQQ